MAVDALITLLTSVRSTKKVKEILALLERIFDYNNIPTQKLLSPQSSESLCESLVYLTNISTSLQLPKDNESPEPHPTIEPINVGSVHMSVSDQQDLLIITERRDSLRWLVLKMAGFVSG